MENDDGQEWIIVGKKKRKMIEKQIKNQKIYIKGGKEQLDRDMMEAMEENFKIDTAINHNTRIIASFLAKHKNKQVIVHCLGLGNFLKNVKPYLQFLFLKHCILEQLPNPHKCNIYDPVFTEQQQQFIKKMKSTCQPLQNIDNNVVHLMFLPHCDRQLYELACQLRSTSNSSMIVIGNSLKDYRHRALILSSQKQEDADKSEMFRNYFPEEIALKDYREAFNDTFIYQLE